MVWFTIYTLYYAAPKPGFKKQTLHLHNPRPHTQCLPETYPKLVCAKTPPLVGWSRWKSNCNWLKTIANHSAWLVFFNVCKATIFHFNVSAALGCLYSLMLAVALKKTVPSTQSLRWGHGKGRWPQRHLPRRWCCRFGDGLIGRAWPLDIVGVDLLNFNKHIGEFSVGVDFSILTHSDFFTVEWCCPAPFSTGTISAEDSDQAPRTPRRRKCSAKGPLGGGRMWPRLP